MADRHLPVRPNLDELGHQAEDLLRALRRGDSDATGTLARHSVGVTPESATLDDAQLALAGSYGLPSWTRLVLACRMTDAIWRDDRATVLDLVREHPGDVGANRSSSASAEPPRTTWSATASACRS